MPDRFNPLMGLDHAKNVGDAGVPAIPGDSPPQALADRYDPQANRGTAGMDIAITEGPSPGAGTGSVGGLPAGVDRFGG